MPHVITKETLVLQSKSGSFRVHQVPSATDNIVWLIVWEEGTKFFGIVIDGPSAFEVLQLCNKKNIELKAILNTHTHGDHIGINLDLRKKGLLKRMFVYGHESVSNKIPGITHPVKNNEVIRIGPLQFRVLLTEGHLNGHVSYVLEEFLEFGIAP